MKEEYKVHSGMTRVGQYVWDIDMEGMELDELDALQDAINLYRKRKLSDSYHLKLRKLIQEAEANGVELLVNTDAFAPTTLTLF